MKYIRTKDEIREFAFTIDGENYYKPLKSKKVNQLCFDKKDIINQADTIEELCDEFIVIIKDNKNANRVFGLEKAEEYWSFMKYKGYEATLYGAIFTDKGLIYVAKMNSEGVMELL